MAKLTGPVHTDGDLLAELGVDPQKWSIAFNEKTRLNVDEETLRAWFSNAISAGESRGYQTGLTAQAGTQEPDPDASDTNWASRNHPDRVAEYVTTGKTPEQKLDEVTAVSSDPGNALADEYMRGMANGLILAQSIVRGTEPQYIEAPAQPTLQERVNHATADDLPHPDNGAVRPDARR